MRHLAILMALLFGGCLGLSAQKKAAPLAKPFDGRIALVEQQHVQTQYSKTRTSLANEPQWIEGTYPVDGIFRGLDEAGVRVLDLSRQRDALRELRGRREVMAPLPESFTDRQRELWREGERRCNEWSRFPAEKDAPPWQIDVRYEERYLCRGQVVQAVWQELLRETGAKIVLEVHNHRWSEFNKGWRVFNNKKGAATVARAIDIANGRTVTALASGEHNVQAALDALSGHGTETSTPRASEVPRLPGQDEGILYDQARAMLERRGLSKADGRGLGPRGFSLPSSCRETLPATLQSEPGDSPFVQAVGEAFANLPKNRGRPAACVLEAVSDTRMPSLRRFRLTCGQDSVFAAWAPGGLVGEVLKIPGGGPRGLLLWPGMDEDPADRMVRAYAAGACLESERQTMLAGGMTKTQQKARKADNTLYRSRQVVNPGAMFRPGSYHLEQTESIPSATSVLGFCDGKLKRIKVERRPVDGDRGPMLEIAAPCQASLLFTGALELTPDRIESARVRPAKKPRKKPRHGEGMVLEEGNPVSVAFGDSTHELSARLEGETGLRVTLRQDRVRQTLFVAPEGDGAQASLLWAGDLDADGALDVHLVVSDHHAVEHHRLFLSGKARGAEFVREAAGFSTLRN